MQSCSTETKDIVTFEISDDVLERAGASSGGPAVTVAYCTYWNECGWPFAEA
jgi:hypothetical protein